jgi:hypothetical protein
LPLLPVLPAIVPRLEAGVAGDAAAPVVPERPRVVSSASARPAHVGDIIRTAGSGPGLMLVLRPGARPGTGPVVGPGAIVEATSVAHVALGM